MSTKPFNLYHVEVATSTALGYVRRCQKVVDDADRVERITQQKCKFCFYAGKMVLNAFDKKPCKICGTEIVSSHIPADSLCVECAIKHKLCRDCGADLELKSRRKL